MSSLPLHPGFVHLPLGLAFMMPALAVGFAWALWRGSLGPGLRVWTAIVVLHALLLGAGLLAKTSGEREEERVEHIVPEAALERHEQYADQFLWATTGNLLLAGFVLLFRRPVVVRSLATATVVGTLAVAAMAVRVGHAGGQLVYQHNAGAAYARQAGSNAGVVPRNEARAALAPENTVGPEPRTQGEREGEGDGGRRRGHDGGRGEGGNGGEDEVRDHRGAR